MRNVILLFGFIFLVSFPAAAQDYSRVGLFGGYTHSETYNSSGSHSSANGATFEVAYYPKKWLGLVANVGSAASNGFTKNSGVHVNSSSNTVHYLFGPRFRFGSRRVTPFVDTLIGIALRSDVTSNGSVLVAAQPSFEFTAGGGLDWKVADHVSIRAIKINYVYTQFTPPGVQNTQNGVSFSTGVVFHWGG